VLNKFITVTAEKSSWDSQIPLTTYIPSPLNSVKPNCEVPHNVFIATVLLVQLSYILLSTVLKHPQFALPSDQETKSHIHTK
jgi:hypothetical protein